VKKKGVLGVNEFYDISKFPAKPGITVVGISMPRIDKAQSPKKLFDSCVRLIPKIKLPMVGDVIVYSDGLYMNSDEKASVLKSKSQRLMEEHKAGYMKLIEKDIYLVRSAYSFTTWSQLILNCPSFCFYIEKLKKIYKKDRIFMKYVKDDIVFAGKKFDDNSVAYILEEILLDYLVAKMRVRLQNDFVQDKEKWILNCYNGKPHRSHVYIHKKNLLKIKSSNIYENCWYDLDAKKLYEFDRLDIDSFDF
jgi:hypothetical protein